MKREKEEREHSRGHILLKSKRVLMGRKKKNMEDSIRGYTLIESIQNNLDQKIESFLSEK